MPWWQQVLRNPDPEGSFLENEMEVSASEAIKAARSYNPAFQPVSWREGEATEAGQTFTKDQEKVRER